jgi:mono/diheme cytochrome c family protein
MAGDFASQPGIRVERTWASLLGAPVVEAQSFSRDGDSDIGVFVNENVLFNDTVKFGADLFLNETFRGNGRTCASCHRKERNFTVDVNFIATLDDDDALFVAEFTPALAFTPFGPKFEVPLLMRKHALIVENVDGMADLVNKFTMRGVPHTLGMRQSLAPIPGAGPILGDGTTLPPNQRTGWSGDGAPGNGTLRDFATGAVTQHFTKRLNRVPGTDFRLPNDAELNAMEAFQLTLGRQVDLVLPLALKDPTALRGQTLFNTGVGAGGGGCSACHVNAGANASFGGGGNRNFNTGVENQRDRPQVLTLQNANIDLTPGVTTNILPRDGGFGQAGDSTNGFGNGTFNSVSLVEAADTGPFFHDNSITTIEGAVEFYNSQEFADANQGGVRLNLAATQVEAIAAFLRVINALDNIRECGENAAASRTRDSRASSQLIRQAIGDCEDAIEVLSTRHLHTKAVDELVSAIRSFQRGDVSGGLRNLARARADIL